MSAHRVLLVGDSASLVDPFSGEGIFAAIKSGKLAAAHIARAMADGDLGFAAYTRQLQAEFTRDYGYAIRLGSIFYRMPKRLLRLYSQAKPLQRFTEELAGAEMNYHAVILRSLRQAPRYFWKRTGQALLGK
jgi:flavin-dependent dehydrogenase